MTSHFRNSIVGPIPHNDWHFINATSLEQSMKNTPWPHLVDNLSNPKEPCLTIIMLQSDIYPLNLSKSEPSFTPLEAGTHAEAVMTSSLSQSNHKGSPPGGRRPKKLLDTSKIGSFQCFQSSFSKVTCHIKLIVTNKWPTRGLGYTKHGLVAW